MTPAQNKEDGMDSAPPFLWLRMIAYLLAAAWWGFWTYFIVAVSIGEGPPPLRISLPLFFLVILFAGVGVVAGVRERIGGVGLIAEGAFLFTLCLFRFKRDVFLFLALSLPPALAGALLLLHWRLTERSP
jgi:hypothetical protein